MNKWYEESCESGSHIDNGPENYNIESEHDTNYALVFVIYVPKTYS